MHFLQLIFNHYRISPLTFQYILAGGEFRAVTLTSDKHPEGGTHTVKCWSNN